jgi:magnesium transporter
MDIFQYNDSEIIEYSCLDLAELDSKKQDGFLRWVNFDDKLGNEFLEFFTKKNEFSILLAEELSSMNSVPKLIVFEDHIFCLFKMVMLNNNNARFYENIGMIITKDTIYTFQEGVKGDAFEDVRTRLRNNLGKIRKANTDYLFWRMIDSIINQYELVLEHYRDQIEELEESMIKNPNIIQTKKIIQLKHSLNDIRKYIVPMKEEISNLRKDDSGIIHKKTMPYFNDSYNNLMQIQSTFDSHREMLRDVLELQNSNQSQAMNQVMKTLTIVSSIFIPLTFIAGVYGMNFEYLPELHYKWSYPAFWGIIIVLSFGMLWFFKRKKWM